MEQGYSEELIEKNLCQTEILDKYFIDLSLASHHFLAKLFVDNNENNNYIYNVDNGWYVFNESNVLQHYGDKFPLSLSDNITKTLQTELKTKYKLLVNTISPDLPKFKKYSSIYSSVYKNIGSNTYKKGIMEELMKRKILINLLILIDSF